MISFMEGVMQHKNMQHYLLPCALRDYVCIGKETLKHLNLICTETQKTARKHADNALKSLSNMQFTWVPFMYYVVNL